MLTSAAASFWDYIPDEIPNEMTWYSKKRKKEYTATSSYIQTASKGKSWQIQWENVSYAYWTFRHQLCGIFIYDSARKAVFIPHEYKDDASNQFILCIIRHLKSAGVLIEISESLRKARSISIIAPAHDVNIRTSQPACYLFPRLSLLLALMPIAHLIMRTRVACTDDFVVLGALVTLSIVLFIAFRILNVKADDAGLSKRSIFGCKSMRWDDVVYYERVYSIYGRCISAIRLTGRDGVKLSIALADVFSTPDREKLIAYADFKLAHLLPTQEAQPSWLAQPSVSLYDTTSIV